MPTIEILPDRKQIDIHSDQSILLASLGAGVPHTHACGGNARCSTCRIIVLEGQENCCPRNQKESKLAQKLGFTDNIRLACQTVVDGNLKVRRVVLDDLDLDIILDSTHEGIKSIGEEKEVTIMFADIANYTVFAESTVPYDVVHFLNRYFRQMGAIIAHHDGQIMDYYGDGFLAVFGLGNKNNHARRAVQASFDMFEKAMDLSSYYNLLSGCDFTIRIGMNTGKVILGNIGIDRMRKLAVIGDEVNLASRIEMANKEMGTRFLISKSTYIRVKKLIKVKDSFNISVKGKSGQYKVYEPSAIK